MGDQINADPVPNVAPFRVMPHGFGQQRHPRHEAKSLGKISKLQIPVQLALLHRPVGSLRQQGIALGCAEQVGGHQANAALGRF